MNQVLDKVKLLNGLKDNPQYDDIINLYIEMAEEEVVDYCGSTVNIPPSLIVQMTNIKFQRRGTEALSNTNYSGNGEVYLNDYPANILRRLEDLKDKSKRRLRTL
jgi:hypothetical protein